MPQIEIPFTPGQRVRAHYGYEFEVHSVQWFGDGEAIIMDYHGRQFAAPVLTLVEPVIEWERERSNFGDEVWVGGNWRAHRTGHLYWKQKYIGHFPNPRAIAEATQKMWNEARKG